MGLADVGGGERFVLSSSSNVSIFAAECIFIIVLFNYIKLFYE